MAASISRCGTRKPLTMNANTSGSPSVVTT